MEKRDFEFFRQSPNRYLAMPGRQLRRATTSVNGRIGSTLKSMKKRVLHRQKARIHIQIRSVDGGPAFLVIGEAKKIVFGRIIYRRERRADT